MTTAVAVRRDWSSSQAWDLLMRVDTEPGAPATAKSVLLAANTLELWRWEFPDDPDYPTEPLPFTVTSIVYEVRNEDHDGYCSDQDRVGFPQAIRTTTRTLELWVTDAEEFPPIQTWVLDPDAHTVCGCSGRVAELVSTGPVSFERIAKDAARAVQF